MFSGGIGGVEINACYPRYPANGSRKQYVQWKVNRNLKVVVNEEERSF